VIGFIWDTQKEFDNIQKHGVNFKTASRAFDAPKRRIRHDPAHSNHEDWFYCIGSVDGKILTVRFTYRKNLIRIIGAGYWRRGKKAYEERYR